jgi:NDP-sugar pyrophosphorylase family protein
MVLCAGFGTRLGDLTRDTPKPLLPVDGEPLLRHTLRYLAGEGVREVVINLHHLGEQIVDAIGDGKEAGLQVRYSVEATPLGTAGAVQHAATLLRTDQPFVVVYGDLLIDQRLGEMVEQHLASSATVTALLHRRAGSNSIVSMDDTRRIVRFLERPDRTDPGEETWVNSGLYVLSPDVPSSLPARTPLDFPRDVFPDLVRRGSLYGFPCDGVRVAVDSPERLEQARASARASRYRRDVVTVDDERGARPLPRQRPAGG